jgi:hypothetical protein
MLQKIYKLKQTQLHQHIQKKQLYLSSIRDIEQEVDITMKQIATASVQSIGAISDFKTLEIHKNTMREYIKKLENKKNYLIQEVSKIDKLIIQLNKKVEKYKYMIDLQLVQKNKQQIKLEEQIASEYVQSRWLAS